jgi:hypothetical protein
MFADKLRFPAAVFLAGAISLFARPALSATSDFHYLAADPSLRARMTNVNVTMGQATHVGKVLERDQTWESPYVMDVAGTVLNLKQANTDG